MMKRTLFVALAAVLGAAAGCSSPSAKAQAPAAKAQAKPKLGIRPKGDTEIDVDMTKISSDELKKVYSYIDEHIDDHVENLQKWIRQPSISNSGEGIPESAEMVKGFFEQLGCQTARVYDVGITEWGAPGNPVVYAKCDYGAPRTIAIYWQYDTMPVTQPDAWKQPPFEANLIEQGPYKKVLIGRGATNSKGPELAYWNALMSIKAVTGTMPVNLIFVAEGDEERMDIGLRKFVKDHPDLFAGADALIGEGGGQSPSGSAGVGGGSEGCVYIELTTSGKAWGRGPVQSDIHGSNKRGVDSPAWRHIKMLSSLVSADGNTPLIAGFTQGMEPMSAEETAAMKKAAEKTDLKVAAENIGVARFISDDPFTMLKMQRYGISFNMDGVWSGNMYAGGAGAILPNKITSKHNMRYVPKMNGLEMVKRIREQLDKQRLQGRRAEDHRRRAVVEDVLRHRHRAGDDRRLRAVQHPARRAGALFVDPRRLLARVSLLEPGRRPARRAGVDADRDGRRRPRRQRARGQRVLHHRRRREGVRDGRSGEGGGDDHLQLRRQEQATGRAESDQQ